MVARSAAEPVHSIPNSVEVNAALSLITIAFPTRNPIMSSLIAAQRILSCFERICTRNRCSPSGVFADILVKACVQLNLSSTIILREVPSPMFSLRKGFSGEMVRPQLDNRKAPPKKRNNFQKRYVVPIFNVRFYLLSHLL